MIFKTIRYFWSIRRQFAKYFIIGITAFFLDVGSLFVLKEYVGIGATYAVVINQPVITCIVFFLNKKWSFRAGGITHHQLVRFYLLAAFNYTFSVAWIHVLHDRFGVQYLAARVMNIILSVLWNFMLYKYWVYAENGKKPLEQAKTDIVEKGSESKPGQPLDV